MATYIIDSDLSEQELREIFEMGNDGQLYEMRTDANSSENYGHIRFVMQPFGATILDEISDSDYYQIKEMLDAEASAVLEDEL